MKRWGFLLAAAVSVAASPLSAAPDEDKLGKGEGYPLCPLSSMVPVH